MNENINLTKILKNCPEGTEFYHAAYGRVYFRCIDLNRSYPIRLSFSQEISDDVSVTSKGLINNNHNGECLLFPSKDQRDWSKFTAPWYKKEKFDPNNLQPFDKVLAKDSSTSLWKIELFSHMIKSRVFSCVCMHTNFMYCIPYNDDTKHLLGTADEAPKFYKYWED